MAHTLDKLCFTALLVTGAFFAARLFALNLPLSMLIAALSPLPFLFLFRRIRSRWKDSRLHAMKTRRARAAETVRYWAMFRDDTCRADILSLLKAAYPAAAPLLGDEIPVITLMTANPVSEEALADRLAELRRTHRERGVIVTTAAFTAEARRLTLLPAPPQVALIDGEMLALLLNKCRDAVPFRRLPPLRARRLTLNRRHAARLIPAALVFYALFLLFRMTLYLPVSLVMLWLALMMQRKSSLSDQLFAE